MLDKTEVLRRKIRRFDLLQPRGKWLALYFSFKVKSYAAVQHTIRSSHGKMEANPESKSELILSLYSRIWRCNFLKILGTDS